MSDTPHINPNDYILSNCVRKNNHQNQLQYYENIDLIVSHPDLIYSDMDISQLSRPAFQESLLTRDLYKFKFLYNFLKSVKNNYDYIFIDCPPNLNFITQNAIYASNFYLVPTKLDKLSTYGILSITHKVNDLNLTFGQINPDYTPTHLLGIIPNNVKEHNGGPITSQNNRLVYLRDTFINSIFTTYLTEGDGIPSASNNSFPVYSLNTPNAQKQSTALLNITYELVDKILN